MILVFMFRRTLPGAAACGEQHAQVQRQLEQVLEALTIGGDRRPGMWSHLQPQQLRKQSRCMLHALAPSDFKEHTACWDISSITV